MIKAFTGRVAFPADVYSISEYFHWNAPCRYVLAVRPADLAFDHHRTLHVHLTYPGSTSKGVSVSPVYKTQGCQGY